MGTTTRSRILVLISALLARPVLAQDGAARPLRSEDAAPKMNVDEAFLELSRRVPGFAGIYLEDGEEVINLTDVAQAHAAEAALGAVLGSTRPTAAWRKVVRRVRFTFQSLHNWRRALENALSIPWIYADVDERRNAVVFGLTDTHTQQAELHVRAFAKALGVPDGALIVEETSPIVPALTLADRVRPVLGGLEVRRLAGTTNLGTCTLGFNAFSGMTAGFVTASHCTQWPGLQSTAVYQGTNFSASEYVGQEAIDPPTFSNDACGYCPAGYNCRLSDAAFVAYGSGVSWEQAAIARTTGFGFFTLSTLLPFRVIQWATYPLLGTPVYTVGAKSGFLQHTVDNTCVDTLTTGYGAPGDILFLCQERLRTTNPASGPGMVSGDSGEPVFLDLGYPDVRLVGIATGFNLTDSRLVYMSDMWSIMNELGPLAVSLTFFY